MCPLGVYSINISPKWKASIWYDPEALGKTEPDVYTINYT
jgi:hypothetical protein